MIVFDGVSHRYGDIAAVRDVTLRVPDGALLVLLDGGGSGKSTLLRTVNRLIGPAAGCVLLGGRDVAGMDPQVLRRGIGDVIRSVGLLPHRSVAGNVATVPRLLGWAGWRPGRDRGPPLDFAPHSGPSPAPTHSRPPPRPAPRRERRA